MIETVQFETLVPGGRAMAHWRGKALFVEGVLPGEVARIEVVRDKRRWAEGVMRELVTPSTWRQGEAEAHYWCCSPWQNVIYDQQLALKRTMLEELYARPELAVPVAEFVASPQALGYRNKLGFGLGCDQNGAWHLAVHGRRSFEMMTAAPLGCALGTAAMNAAAIAIVDGAAKLGVAEAIATVTIRSNSEDALIGIVRLRQPRAEVAWERLVRDGLQGLVVVAPDGAEVWSWGRAELTETVGGMSLMYSWPAFFQVNVPAFQLALERIVACIRPGEAVVDLYGGVGTIGLPVARVAGRVRGVEVMPVAVEAAQANAERNGIWNYQARAAGSEAVPMEWLASADTVIVDPPRAGLTQEMVRMLGEARPERIIYLSCDPATQARDAMALGALYRTHAVTGFDFYPGTLHIESLTVLERL